jgi:hypothetical protein
MRAGSSSVMFVAILAIRCGGEGRSHPQLDKDYADAFTGTWVGPGLLASDGQAPQNYVVAQPITKTGFNRLAIAQMCKGIEGTAGLDTATTFSIDPLTCEPVAQACGLITVRYESGSGMLNQETLSVTLTGKASGCSQNVGFRLTFYAMKSNAPATPPPGLWNAPAGSTPASGNYVYLQSDAGDTIGGGSTFTYTAANATIGVVPSGNRVEVVVAGWTGFFQSTAAVTELQGGYYGDVEAYPFQHPARGGLSWSTPGGTCHTVTGWFVVDSVTYVGTGLSVIDLRFEQHCEGGTPALHGKIHWTASGS